MMRSVCQSLNLFTTALGFLFSVPLVYLVNSNPNQEWLPTNLDQGHLAWYFTLMAAILAVDIVYLIYVSRDYVYKTSSQLLFAEEEENNCHAAEEEGQEGFDKSSAYSSSSKGKIALSDLSERDRESFSKADYSHTTTMAPLHSTTS